MSNRAKVCLTTSLMVLGSFVLTSSRAEASVITINSCFTGACTGTGAVTGSVVVTITQSGDNLNFLVQNQTNGFVDELGLFYSPNGLPAGTQLTNFVGTSGNGTEAPQLQFIACANNEGGEQTNTCQDYTNSNSGGGALRFNAGEFVTFTLDAPTALLEAAFLTTEGYVHIQGLPAGGVGSAKLIVPGPGGGGVSTQPVVPEPASMLLLGSGLAAVAARMRKRRKA